MVDVADAAFLDDDFQECWWVGDEDGDHVLKRGWATRQGEQRAIVYIAGGAVWSGSHETYRDLLRRLAHEARVKREAGTLTTPRRYDVARRGAVEYLKGFRRETGGLPSQSTWASAWRGDIDAGGRQITVKLPCVLCRLERTVGIGSADAVATVYQDGGFECAMLRGPVCGERLPLSRGQVFDFLQTTHQEVPSRSRDRSPSIDARQLTSRILEETSRNSATEESDSVEVVGFSAAAKQFYKARGPQLHTPTYRGEPSEVDLLAWKRGIEKYFETYGVSRPREKVSLAADLLEGEAAK